MIKFTHQIKDHLLYEGLIHSVPRSTFKDMVDRWAIVNDKIKISFKDYNKILIQFTENINEKELENLLILINNLGWYVSVFLVGDKDSKPSWIKFDKDIFKKEDTNKSLYAFQVEAKFDLDVTDREFKVLYHVTPSVHDLKIKRIGLVPKSLSKSAYHPERIYFLQTVEECKFIAGKFNKQNRNLKEFSIYAVDIKLAERYSGYLRLFNDPNLRGSVYTLSNIPPQCIKFVEKITI